MERLKPYTVVVIGMCILPAALLFAIGIRSIIRQYRMITTYQRVKVQIISSYVKRSSAYQDMARVEDYYRPAIEYTYEVEGKTFKSNRVTIFPSHTGKGWAISVVRQYPEAETATAFYNPKNPADSYLYNSYLFLEAYALILWSTPLWMGVVVLYSYYFGHVFAPRIPEPVRGSPWFEIPAYIRNRDKLKFASLALGVAAIFAVPTLCHYYWVAAPPYDRDAVLHTYGCCAILAVMPGPFFIYYLLVFWSVGEFRIFSNTDHFSLGDVFDLRIVHQLGTRALIERTRIVFACEQRIWRLRENWRWYQEKMCDYGRDVYSDTIVPGADLPEALFGGLDFVHQCAIPKDMPPSTDRHTTITRDIPRHYWHVRVTVSSGWLLRYDVEFPITVEPETSTRHCGNAALPE
jgi:hypothetical protein